MDIDAKYIFFDDFNIPELKIDSKTTEADVELLKDVELTVERKMLYNNYIEATSGGGGFKRTTQTYIQELSKCGFVDAVRKRTDGVRTDPAICDGPLSIPT